MHNRKAQKHFGRNYSSQGVPDQLEKIRKFQGVRVSDKQTLEWKLLGSGGSKGKLRLGGGGGWILFGTKHSLIE